MKKQVLAAASLVLAGTLAGCGGGSTTGTTGTAGVVAISGKVADGYLANAMVFMDKNGNYQLDPGEPSAMTDANGNYMLAVDPADVGKYPVVAMVKQGVTSDKDTNQTVTATYVLSMPKNSVSSMAGTNFISPMTSELREMMETGKYATIQDAMTALNAKMKVSGTNMLTDYIAGQNGTMHLAAQNTATLMGSQMPQLFTTSGGMTTMDVNRYRGMMGAIFSNMSTIKNATAQGNMTTLTTNMTTYMSSITAGMPYRNMSSSFGGMMGGSLGGMMGGTSGSTTTGGSMPTGGTMM